MKADPTSYRDLNEVLAEFVGGVRSILGDDLVAACLQGSFAVGDADEHSDCDWVMAIARPLTDDRVAALQEDFCRIYDLPSPWAQHLEGSYFPVDVLRSVDRVGEELWYLDNGAREMIRSTHCNRRTSSGNRPLAWTVIVHCTCSARPIAEMPPAH